jgi:hypothetical protein
MLSNARGFMMNVGDTAHYWSSPVKVRWATFSLTYNGPSPFSLHRVWAPLQWNWTPLLAIQTDRDYGVLQRAV